MLNGQLNALVFLPMVCYLPLMSDTCCDSSVQSVLSSPPGCRPRSVRVTCYHLFTPYISILLCDALNLPVRFSGRIRVVSLASAIVNCYIVMAESVATSLLDLGESLN